MTYQEFNHYCESLLATTYVIQWGGSHVWKVGGKVFAVGGWEKLDEPAFTFKASDYNFNLLQDEEGFRPAPYLASRGMQWIQQYKKIKQNTDEELQHYIKESHRIVLIKHNSPLTEFKCTILRNIIFLRQHLFYIVDTILPH